MSKDKVLIVEDEQKVSKILSLYFQKENFETMIANNGQEGVDLFKSFNPDLIILDIMMPIKNGWEAAKEIREISDVPIVIMTALSSEDDVLKGYSLKVDDYVIKPVNPKILIAKVKNIIEKNKGKSQDENIINLNPLQIDLTQRKIFLDGNELKLSKTEFDILVFFAHNNHKACSRSLLLEQIWGESVYIDDRIIDKYVKNLRKLLKPYDFIKTVFGVGYRFEI
jgi:DNA-binding response OmpR family regulator